MTKIKIYKNINLTNPVMIAGWPGMGSVALGVVNYLRRKMGAMRFAEIEIDRNITLDSVVVENGVASLPPAPRNVFYYTTNPELIIFEGEAQLSGERGLRLLNAVIDVAAQHGVSKIYTGASFPLPLSHEDQPEIYGAANKPALVNIFKKLGIKTMDSGHISGLNGLLLSFAEKKGINALCLLATIPQYAISLPNPKASLAIIEVLSRALQFKIDEEELKGYVAEMDEKMGLIEDKVKEVFIPEPEDLAPQAVDKKIPEYIMERIEKLFQESLTDRAKALILKKELDRWDLYKNYEDRFLDLFKERR